MKGPGSTAHADVRLLLEDAHWIRALARSLVRDVDRAEDLSQEVWKRLLERPIALDRPFRGWIATVMRNRLRADARADARRESRERASARGEALPAADALVERAALQSEVVQAVLALDEPYRGTVLLRYFEDRSPREIARLQGVPVATVKTRLVRALARLRARLDRSRMADGTTPVLLALLRTDLGLPRPPVPWPLLAASMKTKLVLPAAALVAAGLALLYTREPAPRAAVVLVSDSDLVDELPMPAEPVVDPVPRTPGVEDTGRAPLTPSRSRESAPVPATPSARIAGSVIDLDGRPVGGLEIVIVDDPGSRDAVRSAPTVARCTDDGTFVVNGGRSGKLLARGEGWITLLFALPVDARSGQECRIVVAPGVRLAGEVVDALGRPVAGAHVALALPAGLRTRFQEVMDFSGDTEWGTGSDAEGRFDLGMVPGVPDATLRAVREGLVPHEEPEPRVDRADLVLVLATPDARTTLRGTVVDAAGAPVAEAFVSLGVDTTRSDEEGRFEFWVDDPDSVTRGLGSRLQVPVDVVRAVAAGHQPGEVHARRDTAGVLRWPDPLRVEVGGQPLTIEGRVEDEHGEPLEGVRVWASDPTTLGVSRDGGRMELVHLEDVLAGREPGWSWSESNASGRFVLEGLAERAYTVAAMDAATLQRVLERDIPAGQRGVTIVLRSGDLFPRLAGRVLDSRGTPVGGVQVFPMCDALESTVAGTKVATQHEVAHGTVTDAEGLFVLERVPKDLAYLRLEGTELLPLEWGRGLAGGLARLVGSDPEKLEITIERRCHFQVELAVPDEADSIGVLDARGNELSISEFRGNQRSDDEHQQLVEGRSNTLAVSDRARTLVLYRAGSEVRRTPIELDAGSLTTLKP